MVTEKTAPLSPAEIEQVRAEIKEAVLKSTREQQEQPLDHEKSQDVHLTT